MHIMLRRKAYKSFRPASGTNWFAGFRIRSNGVWYVALIEHENPLPYVRHGVTNPRERRHPTTRLASAGSSNSQVENNLNDYQEFASDLPMDCRSIYVLPGTPAIAPPAPPAVSHLSACTARTVLSKESRPMPMPLDESINGSGCAIPGRSSREVNPSTRDWECVRSVPRLSANTDSDDSECDITEVCTHASRDAAMRTRDDESEPESWALDVVDGEAMHWHAARQWDLIPEYFTPGVPIPRDALLLRMHGRPLDSQRTPPERSHRSACSETRSLPPIPHHCIRIPLLSVLVSLLSIDDETLRLVELSPTRSELFPGPICPSDDGSDNTQESHGVHALLESSSQHGALRKGLAVACDESVLSSNPFGLSALPFIRVLDLVRGFWAEGRKLYPMYADE